MARDYNDYEELLKNFDDYSSKKPENSSRDIMSNSADAHKDTRPDFERHDFVKADFKPTPIRSSSENNIYFDKPEPPTPKRKQNPNSPFYRDPEKDLPTPKSSNRGNDAFKAAKGILPKSRADEYLDELDKEETRKRNYFERENKKNTYKGEVYFSNPPQEIKEEAERQRREKTSNSPYGKYARNGRGDKMTSAPPVTQKQRREIAMKKRNKERKAQGLLNTKEKLQRLAIYVLIVAATSAILCFYGIRCINDILAIEKKDYECEVTISTGATDNEVVSVLKDHDLIKNELFCKLFVKFVNGSGDYISGSYTLNSDWGLEKMLSTMQEGYNYAETITLTFPEGYTVDQIAEKLEANKVCTASSFIKTMQSVDFSAEYTFLKNQKNKELKFRMLEGYIYPDTYEFYIGENASSVVRRFLDNFEAKWISDYQKRADELDMTVDEIITLASIIQAEAANANQVKDISSVLHNRLNKPGTFPKLECDSTEKYLIETIKPTLTSSTTDTQKYIAYRDLYDTYSNDCKGLPVGAICNPGNAAINAALNPSDTNYNYFRHDVKGGVYYANTFDEHNQNGYKASAVTDDED